mmetsp:Transcript_20221/g.40767  ORF Transcript_20221/g.40767 Transcript_20221/m.40767 type:complete len:230 (-) Transcript_20221:92-781(-)
MEAAPARPNMGQVCAAPSHEPRAPKLPRGSGKKCRWRAPTSWLRLPRLCAEGVAALHRCEPVVHMVPNGVARGGPTRAIRGRRRGVGAPIEGAFGPREVHLRPAPAGVRASHAKPRIALRAAAGCERLVGRYRGSDRVVLRRRLLRDGQMRHGFREHLRLLLRFLRLLDLHLRRRLEARLLDLDLRRMLIISARSKDGRGHCDRLPWSVARFLDRARLAQRCAPEQKHR